MNALKVPLLIVFSTLLGSGCLTGRAATPAERPALEVPPPPERVIPQVPAPAVSGPDLVEDLPPYTKPAPPARNTRPAPPASKDPVKTEPKPETPPPAADPPAQQPPVPQLRMPAAGDSNAVARQITDIIERTRRALNGIDYRTLSAARRKAYDDAKLFAQQAEDALKAANLVFAKELADKAERLAKELQGR